MPETNSWPVLGQFLARSTYQAHRIGANNTKPPRLFLLSVMNFYHFPQKFLAVTDPRRRRPRHRGNSMRAMNVGNAELVAYLKIF
jgi:hypothetical protein